MKLTNQALGAIMMALQQSILDQSDIVPILKGFDFLSTPEGLIVENPPVVKFTNNVDEEENLNENA